MEWAQGAAAMFEKQPAREKRRLLDFVLSNCSWKGGELTTEYRQPFDMLAVAVQAQDKAIAASVGIPAKTIIGSPAWIRPAAPKAAVLPA